MLANGGVYNHRRGTARIKKNSVGPVKRDGSPVRHAPMPPQRYPWRIFWVLLAAALIGSVAILPYILEIFAHKFATEGAAAPRALIIGMQLLHLVLVFGIATGLGLLLAPKAGIELPYLQRWINQTPSETRPHTLRVALIAGVVIGALTVLMLYAVILPRIPQFPTEANVALWKRLGVCIYGAINEELLIRLFLLSLVLWGLQAVARRSARSSPTVFWIGNVLVALLFGAAYLPATASIIELTPFAIVSIIMVKGASGIVFGHLCWTRGLEAAMVAHLVSDLLIHGAAPSLFGR
jgi:hypothetical protein